MDNHFVNFRGSRRYANGELGQSDRPNADRWSATATTLYCILQNEKRYPIQKVAVSF